jgi:hypothetical protein
MIVFLMGCGTHYHYYSPVMNTAQFADRGETHFFMNTGTTGTSLGGGYALKENISFLSGFHFSSPQNYHGKEIETSVHITRKDSSAGRMSITPGIGIGNSYWLTPGGELKDFRGTHYRPFLMFTIGSAKKDPIVGNFIHADAAFSVRVNYLLYNGYEATTIGGKAEEKDFIANNFFLEPYLNFSAGGGKVRVNWGVGAAIKKKYEWGKNLAVFPLEANVGLLIIFSRKYERKNKKEDTSNPIPQDYR